MVNEYRQAVSFQFRDKDISNSMISVSFSPFTCAHWANTIDYEVLLELGSDISYPKMFRSRSLLILIRRLTD